MRKILLAGALGALLAAPATPQSAELGISAGYGVLGDKTLSEFDIAQLLATDSYSLRNGVRVGARMALNTRAFTGHEISYAFQSGGLDFATTEGGGSNDLDLGSIKAHHMSYNFVAHATPAGTPIRPFVTGGGGFSSFFLPNQSSFSGRGDTKFGYNFGGGIKFNVLSYGFRLDVRNHVTGKPFRDNIPNIDGRLNNLEFSVTFSLLLG